ncbi:MAG: 30S ribosomal protein S14 [Enterobacteriaceae bacterium]|nr:30S ribosomal protein S14 [Enterobacteriaceae bacterium]
MSKLCMKTREKRRVKLSKKYFSKRKHLRKIINDHSISIEEKEIAQKTIQKFPKDSALCRLRNRCWKTGRGNGVYRIVGMCRNMFRHHAMFGDIPGIRKASW